MASFQGRLGLFPQRDFCLQRLSPLLQMSDDPQTFSLVG